MSALLALCGISLIALAVGAFVAGSAPVALPCALVGAVLVSIANAVADFQEEDEEENQS